MNSDPHDSAAWRTFGMLDAGESALFEDAMRQDPELRRTGVEMDRLAAALAAIRAEPVCPSPEHLERLQRALGHSQGPRKCALWLAVTGWSTAAALAALLAWLVFTGVDEKPSALPREVARPAASAIPTVQDTPLETRRLMVEIDVLRQNLEEFHQRDRAMFQVLPGRAMQIVMTMVPPGADASGTLATTAMLGDALAAINREATAGPLEIENATEDENPGAWPAADADVVSPAPPAPPAAVPIYDAARDTGTLVVSNLPPAPRGKVYQLWVSTSASTRPVYLGKLPDNSVSGAESFDFSLGSTMILPTSFTLTLGPAGTPAPPTEENTVLAGPPTAAR
jgi:anti-sigma-K factor RskA